MPISEFDISLSPLGKITLTHPEPWYSGRLYDIWSARYQGREVLCKCVKRDLKSPEIFSAEYEDSGSQTGFWSASTGLVRELSPTAVARYATQFLLLEAETIRQSSGHWNHDILGLGFWDSEFHLYEEMCLTPRELQPVMVMPKYDALGLSHFRSDILRKVFPRMLPSLWNALKKRSHCDLTADNILIDINRARFMLIDPGVCLFNYRSIWSARKALQNKGEHGGFDGNGASDRSLFLTTSTSYPLLNPFFNGCVRLGNGPSKADWQAVGLLYYKILCGEPPLAPEMKPLWLDAKYRMGMGSRTWAYTPKEQSFGVLKDMLKPLKTSVSDAEKQLCLDLMMFEIQDFETLKERLHKTLDVIDRR